MSVGEMRERLHRLSHRLEAFSQDNRADDDWCRFYAATDTLLDVGTALSDFNSIKRSPSVLERYGFLQALVIAQQAVEELSKSVGLNWSSHDNVNLKQVRELRDRIAGHPVWSEKSRKYNYERSSAMLDLSDTGKDGFDVILYFETRSETVFVSFEDLQRKNNDALSIQLSVIEKTMLQLNEKYLAEKVC